MRHVLPVFLYLLMALPVFGASPCRNFDFVPYTFPLEIGGAVPAGFIRIVKFFEGTLFTFELEFLVEIRREIFYDPNHPNGVVVKTNFDSLPEELNYICGPDWVRDNFPPLASSPRVASSQPAVPSPSDRGYYSSPDNRNLRPAYAEAGFASQPVRLAPPESH